MAGGHHLIQSQTAGSPWRGLLVDGRGAYLSSRVRFRSRSLAQGSNPAPEQVDAQSFECRSRLQPLKLGLFHMPNTVAEILEGTSRRLSQLIHLPAPRSISANRRGPNQ